MAKLIMDYPGEGEALRALQTMYGYVRHDPKDENSVAPSTAEVVNSAWVIIGYGAKVVAPGDMKSLVYLHGADQKEELHKLLAAHLVPAFGGGVVLKSIPWGQLVPIVIQVLQVVLSQA